MRFFFVVRNGEKMSTGFEDNIEGNSELKFEIFLFLLINYINNTIKFIDLLVIFIDRKMKTLNNVMERW